MRKTKSFKEWKQVWDSACALKKPAQRREALEVLLDAPIDVVFQVARSGRKLISPSLELPKPDGGGRYFFAARFRKNVLRDAIQIDVWQTRRRLRIEQILICHDITVSRTPGYHLVRANILAAAGTVDGYHAVNVTEYLTSDELPHFRATFQCSLPKLRQYKYRGSPVRCVWSPRALVLPTWKRRLATRADADLQQALDELDDLVYSTDMSDDVEQKMKQALNPLLIKHMWHKDAEISLRSIQIWNGLNTDRMTSVPIRA